jgi:DNA topoisomerase-3
LLPTTEAARFDLDALPAGERDVLNLIALRLLCAAATPHVYEAVTVTLDCAGHSFTAKGRAVLENGWKAAEQAFFATLRERPESREEAPVLPELAVGQTYRSVAASVKEGHTSPPRRYSEGDLLAAMENSGAKDMPTEIWRGLGTPATRAGVIERLIKSSLAARKAKHIVPTEKGSALIAVLPDTLKSPALTAIWEHRLCGIERGEFSDAAFMEDIAAMTRELVAEHPVPVPEHAAMFPHKDRGEVVGPCPRCGGGVFESPKGYFCGNRACKFGMWKDSRFFAAKRKTLDAKTAAALLTEGRVFFSDLYSEKTGKTYAASILLEDAGGKTGYKLEFEKGGTRR